MPMTPLETLLLKLIIYVVGGAVGIFLLLGVLDIIFNLFLYAVAGVGVFFADYTSKRILRHYPESETCENSRCPLTFKHYTWEHAYIKETRNGTTE